jgi:hypothetical protein
MNKFGSCLLAGAVAVSSVALPLLVAGWWIQENFGEIGVVVAGLSILLCVALCFGALIAWLIQRTTLNAIVDFQAADDRGEVARANVYREMMRGEREFSKDVRRAALPLAKQQAHYITERKQLEWKRQHDTEEDDWYALPGGQEVKDGGEW